MLFFVEIHRYCSVPTSNWNLKKLLSKIFPQNPSFALLWHPHSPHSNLSNTYFFAAAAVHSATPAERRGTPHLPTGLFNIFTFRRVNHRTPLCRSHRPPSPPRVIHHDVSIVLNRDGEWFTDDEALPNFDDGNLNSNNRAPAVQGLNPAVRLFLVERSSRLAFCLELIIGSRRRAPWINKELIIVSKQLDWILEVGWRVSEKY